MANPPFMLSVFTPEGQVCAIEVSHVIAPGSDGYLGILANHAPLVTSLDIGIVNYTPAEGGQEQVLAVANGYLEVANNQVSILADSAEAWDEIDLERAQESLKRAEERLKVLGPDVDMDRAQKAVQRALNRVRVKEKKFNF